MAPSHAVPPKRTRLSPKPNYSRSTGNTNLNRRRRTSGSSGSIFSGQLASKLALLQPPWGMNNNSPVEEQTMNSYLVQEEKEEEPGNGGVYSAGFLGPADDTAALSTRERRRRARIAAKELDALRRRFQARTKLQNQQQQQASEPSVAPQPPGDADAFASAVAFAKSNTLSPPSEQLDESLLDWEMGGGWDVSGALAMEDPPWWGKKRRRRRQPAGTPRPLTPRYTSMGGRPVGQSATPPLSPSVTPPQQQVQPQQRRQARRVAAATTNVLRERARLRRAMEAGQLSRAEYDRMLAELE